jgi:hypothetical protein
MAGSLWTPSLSTILAAIMVGLLYLFNLSRIGCDFLLSHAFNYFDVVHQYLYRDDKIDLAATPIPD